MGHYDMTEKPRKFTPKRTDDIYEAAIAFMKDPISASDIARAINLANGSIFALLDRMCKAGVAKREKVDGRYLYHRLEETITRQEMFARKPVVFEKKPTLPGARIIDFGTPEMMKKLHALDEVYLKDRKKKTGKVYVSGQTLDMVS